MDDKPKDSKTLYIVLVILGLLLSCGLGALLGGTAGFFAGRRSAMANIGRTFGGRMMPWLETPVPVVPGVPRMTPRAGMPFAGEGAVVMDVVADSPADLAGLRRADIILVVDDQVLGPDSDLRDVLDGYQPGDMIDLTIMRGAKELTVSVELGNNPDTSITRPWLGISYRMLSSDE
jgi:hypothetical protein